MKKLICIIMCMVFSFGLLGCGEKNDTEKYNILVLAEKDIEEGKTFEIVDKEGNVIVENEDVEKVLVSFEKSRNRYLEILLTKSGKRSVKKALKKKDCVLTIVLDKENLVSPVLLDDIEEKSVIALGEYEDVMDWFNAIT